MAYKLVIENTVKVPVKFTLNDAGKERQFSFTLICDRLTQEEIAERTKESTFTDFMRSVGKGWQGQTLVVDEDGNPVEFDAGTFDMMLSVSGVSMVAFNAYMKECGAKGKN